MFLCPGREGRPPGRGVGPLPARAPSFRLSSCGDGPQFQHWFGGCEQLDEFSARLSVEVRCAWYLASRPHGYHLVALNARRQLQRVPGTLASSPAETCLSARSSCPAPQPRQPRAASSLGSGLCPGPRAGGVPRDWPFCFGLFSLSMMSELHPGHWHRIVNQLPFQKQTNTVPSRSSLVVQQVKDSP